MNTPWHLMTPEQRLAHDPAIRELVLGLDLGQQRDYTALAIAERVPGIEPGPASWHINHLERWPLGTTYPAIVAAVAGRVAALLAIDDPGGVAVSLAVDATGVGRPVLDLLRGASLRVPLLAISITGGDRATRAGDEASVPKRDLVSTVAVLLQSGRLKIAEALPLAPVLVAELANLRAKVSLNGHVRFEAGPGDPTDHWRAGGHDDLVLAAALALWHGERDRDGGDVHVADHESRAAYRRMLGLQ